MWVVLAIASLYRRAYDFPIDEEKRWVLTVSVRFFASIREALGTDRLKLPLSEREATAGAIAQRLAREGGADWSAQLLAPNTLVALNGEMVSRDTVVADGDELAFFPPVTGG